MLSLKFNQMIFQANEAHLIGRCLLISYRMQYITLIRLPEDILPLWSFVLWDDNKLYITNIAPPTLSLPFPLSFQGPTL